MKTKNEDVYSYLQKIRTGIQGYGPKHSKVFKILAEEDFDFTVFIEAWLEDIDQTFLSKHIEWSENISKAVPNPQVIEAFKRLEAFRGADYIKNNIRLNDFRDASGQKLHELVFEYFPELFDKDQKIIDKYRSNLFRVC